MNKMISKHLTITLMNMFGALLLGVALPMGGIVISRVIDALLFGIIGAILLIGSFVMTSKLDKDGK